MPANHNYDIPSFMLTKEYDEKVKRHQKAMEEEERNLEAQRRYRLEKKAEEKRIRNLKRKRVRAFKFVALGLTITVVGTFFVNSFIKSEAEEVLPIEPYTVEAPLRDNSAEPEFEEEYRIRAKSAPSYEEEIETIEIDLSYDARLNSINPDGVFAVGSKVNEYFLNVLEDSEAYPLFIKYGEMYGIDPYLLIAKSYQESSLSHSACIPGGEFYNGYGVGIMQHESPDGREVTAYNYQTNEYDTMYITMENAIDLEKNIRMGAMHFQNCIIDNYGNPLLALQTYNYGVYMMNSILKDYSEMIGKSVDDIKSDYHDTGWLALVADAHVNAWKHVRGWNGTYGDDEYIKHVLRYFIGDSTYYCYGDEKYVFDFNTQEILTVTSNVHLIK